MRHEKLQLKRSLLSLAIASVTQVAIANESSNDTTAQEDKKIEVIMVSAQKRVQRIIDVPTSIVSVDEKAISNSSSQKLGDIQDLVPNLTIDDSNSFNNAVSIRGVGASSRNISFDTRVGVYLDGVYLGQSPGLNQDLMDIERIEVLRGPQGSLFGKNTVAGAINILTKKPSDELEGKVRARIGNYNSREFSGYINVPINDDVALKVSGGSTTRDGFVKNVYPGAEGDLSDQNSKNYRAQLYVSSFENLELTFSVDSLTANEAPLFNEQITDFIGATLVEPQAQAKRVTYTDFLAKEERDVSGLSVEAIYDFDDGSSFKSITAQRDTKLDFNMDLDNTSIDFYTLPYVDEYDQFTQEFQYTSNTNSKIEYIVGLYYYQQDSFSDRSGIVGSQVIPIIDQTFLASTLAQFGLDTFEGTPYESLYPGSVNHIGTIDTESYAVFTNITYDFSQDWEVGLGLRWGKETKEVDWTSNGSTSGMFNFAQSNYVDELDESDFLPSLSVNYNVNSNTVAYFRYATGSKSGGFNLDFITEEQLDYLTFDKESSTNFEIGLKGYTDDNTFRYSVTLFTTDFEDYQQTQFVDIGDSRTIIAISNAAEVTTSGIETELSYDVTDNFTLGFSAGLLKAEFDKFEQGGSVDDPDVSGKRLPYSAEIQAVLTLDYTQEFGNDLAWFIHSNVSYTGDMYTTPNNIKTYTTFVSNDTLDFGYLPSRTSVNARIGIEAENWNAALWIRNALDSDDLVSTNRQFFGGINQAWNAPQTFGAEVTYSF
jgi:iron complex outermembrane receptor protein